MRMSLPSAAPSRHAARSEAANLIPHSSVTTARCVPSSFGRASPPQSARATRPSRLSGAAHEACALGFRGNLGHLRARGPLIRGAFPPRSGELRRLRARATRQPRLSGAARLVRLLGAAALVATALLCDEQLFPSKSDEYPAFANMTLAQEWGTCEEALRELVSTANWEHLVEELTGTVEYVERQTPQSRACRMRRARPRASKCPVRLKAGKGSSPRTPVFTTTCCPEHHFRSSTGMRLGTLQCAGACGTLHNSVYQRGQNQRVWPTVLRMCVHQTRYNIRACGSSA